MDLSERIRGAILGLAAGDALGASVDNAEPGEFAEVQDLVGGGPHGLEPGEWTDDTSLTLALAESLAELGRFDLADQIERYRRWYRKGRLASNGRCFDIGEVTREALRRYELSGDPKAGIEHEMSAGNSCLPRTSAVAIAFHRVPAVAVAHAREACLATHAALESVDAARYLAGLIVGVLGGASKRALLDRPFSPVPGLWEREPLTPTVRDVAFGSFRESEPPDIEASGHAVRSLEAALWAFHRTETFRDGAIRVVNLGGEASTVGAIYGALAGAFYREGGVPASWRGKLAQRDLLDRSAVGLLRFAQGQREESATPSAAPPRASRPTTAASPSAAPEPLARPARPAPPSPSTASPAKSASPSAAPRGEPKRVKRRVRRRRRERPASERPTRGARGSEAEERLDEREIELQD